MGELPARPVDASARIPQMGAFALSPAVNSPPAPSAILQIAPPAPYPLANPPHPPPGNFYVVVIRVGFHSLSELRLVDQPQMAGMQIGLIHRPVGPLRHSAGVVLQGSPEIT